MFSTNFSFDLSETIKIKCRDKNSQCVSKLPVKERPRSKTDSVKKTTNFEFGKVRVQQIKGNQEKKRVDAKGKLLRDSGFLEGESVVIAPSAAEQLYKKRHSEGGIKPLESVECKSEPQEAPNFFRDIVSSYDGALGFEDMRLSRPVLKALDELGFRLPTPIQNAAIPIALRGRDVCGCAKTGSGKTVAFLVPLVERLLYAPHSLEASEGSIRALILSPTRELAVQLFEVCQSLCRFAPRLRVGLAVGGLDLREQQSQLRRTPPDILVATPGRLVDHIRNSPSFTLANVVMLILDEADRMLDDGFLEQMKDILRQCPPARRQTLLFSATMTDNVKELMAVSLREPVKIFVDENTDLVSNLEHEFIKLKRRLDTPLPPVPPVSVSKREASISSASSPSTPAKANSGSELEHMDMDADEDAQDPADSASASAASVALEPPAAELGAQVREEGIDEDEDAPMDMDAADDAAPSDEEDEDNEDRRDWRKQKRGGRRHKKLSIMERFPIDIDRDAIVAMLLTNGAALGKKSNPISTSRCIVFGSTRTLIHRLYLVLKTLRVRVGELHGKMKQPQRLETLKRFQNGELDVLAATDLASRGLDILDVDTVINHSMPQSLKAYIHRVGRTARAGKSGRAISIVTEEDRMLLKLISKKLPVLRWRQLPPELQKAFRDRIADLGPEIANTMRAERIEREAQLAEIEVQRAENLLKYRDEIFSRPKRTFSKKNWSGSSQGPQNKAYKRGEDEDGRRSEGGYEAEDRSDGGGFARGPARDRRSSAGRGKRQNPASRGHRERDMSDSRRKRPVDRKPNFGMRGRNNRSPSHSPASARKFRPSKKR